MDILEHFQTGVPRITTGKFIRLEGFAGWTQRLFADALEFAGYEIVAEHGDLTIAPRGHHPQVPRGTSSQILFVTLPVAPIDRLIRLVDQHFQP